jgi:hypothetical protein
MRKKFAVMKQLEALLKPILFGRGQETIRKESKLPHIILVGTHHKTGTVWMLKIFREIAVELNMRFSIGSGETLPPNTDIFLGDHSRFALKSLQVDYRGLHVIRDPRDRIVSGCFYHQKANEPWLHERKAALDGLTYQEKINSYASFDDKLLFEIEHSGKFGVYEMLRWNYENPNFFEVKYENLINDKNLFLFHQIFTFLGFSGKTIPRILEIAHNNSLFSDNIPKSVHVRSGESGQWKQYFKPVHRRRFVELFGDALIRLGYEKNNAWADN